MVLPAGYTLASITLVDDRFLLAGDLFGAFSSI